MVLHGCHMASLLCLFFLLFSMGRPTSVLSFSMDICILRLRANLRGEESPRIEAVGPTSGGGGNLIRAISEV